MLELPLIQPHKLLDQSLKIWEPPLWLLNLTAVSLWEPILEHHQVIFYPLDATKKHPIETITDIGAYNLDNVCDTDVCKWHLAAHKSLIEPIVNFHFRKLLR